VSRAAARGAFAGVTAVLFALTTASTIAWTASMSAMGGMPMPGGWTMSMTWMRMPGRTWPGAASAFVGMWIVMMAAMMLPSLTPVLWRYHERVVAMAPARAGRSTMALAAGYFAVWTALGIAVFPLGVALAELAMQQPAAARVVPAAGALLVLIVGATQFGAAKARHLACCRDVPIDGPAPHQRLQPAWRAGLRHGLRCARACAGPTAVLFALGVMDPVVMALVSAAITLERLVPSGARAIGLACALGGLVLLGRAAGLA